MATVQEQVDEEDALDCETLLVDVSSWLRSNRMPSETSIVVTLEYLRTYDERFGSFSVRLIIYVGGGGAADGAERNEFNVSIDPLWSDRVSLISVQQIASLQLPSESSLIVNATLEITPHDKSKALQLFLLNAVFLDPKRT